MNIWEAGSRDALSVLGVIKTADALYAGPDGEKLPFWDSVKAHTTRQLVGKPAVYRAELKSGRWSEPGSYTRSAIWPVSPADPKAGLLRRSLSYAMPALYYLPSAVGLWAASQAPRDYKGELYGSALGGLLGAVAGAPLGVLGSTVGTLAGGSLGSVTGKYLQHGGVEPSYYEASAQGPA